MPPRKKPSTKPVNSWNDAGNLMREYAETLEQQQRVMKALAGFFEDKAGSVRLVARIAAAKKIAPVPCATRPRPVFFIFE